LLALLELAAWWLGVLILRRTQLDMAVARGLSGAVGLLVSLALTALLRPPSNGVFSLDWLASSAYIAIVCLALWSLGTYRAAEGAGFDYAYSQFRTGVIAMSAAALLLVVSGGKRAGLVQAELGATPLWFFAWSLLCLALGNREIVREESGSGGRTGAWALVLGVSVGLVIASSVLAGVLGGENLIVFGQQVVSAVVLAIGVAAYLLLYAVMWLISLLGIRIGPFSLPDNPNRPGPDRFFEWLNQVRRDLEAGRSPLGIPSELQTIATWLTGSAVALVVIWLVARGLRRTRLQRTRYADEEHGSFARWTLLLEQLRAWISLLLQRFRKSKREEEAQTGDDSLTALFDKPEWRGTLSIRQVYARLLAMAAAYGYPRAPQQTPTEYLQVLSRAMPTLEPDLEDITSAYLQARYAATPASGPVTAAAMQAWQRVEPALKTGLGGSDAR
jgi:hypothetical protein